MWRWAGKALIFGKLNCFYVNLKNWDKFLEVPDLAVNRFSPTIGGGIFFLLFAVPKRVSYNYAMTFTDRNRVLRIFLYLLLFLISFLVFDSITVVATVLFAVAALDLFFSRADQKEGR